jgi:SAM-dependent methyltransferase
MNESSGHTALTTSASLRGCCDHARSPGARSGAVGGRHHAGLEVLARIGEAERASPVGGACCGPHCACLDCTEAPGTGDPHSDGIWRGLTLPGEANMPSPSVSLDEVRVGCSPDLATEGGRALAEAHRALKPGGRLVVSDTTWVVEPPAEVRRSLRGTMSCLAGAPTLDEYVRRLVRAGFREVRAERHPDGDRTPSLGWEPPPAGVAPTLGVVLTAIK